MSRITYACLAAALLAVPFATAAHATTPAAAPRDHFANVVFHGRHDESRRQVNPIPFLLAGDANPLVWREYYDLKPGTQGENFSITFTRNAPPIADPGDSQGLNVWYVARYFLDANHQEIGGSIPERYQWVDGAGPVKWCGTIPDNAVSVAIVFSYAILGPVHFDYKAGPHQIAEGGDCVVVPAG